MIYFGENFKRLRKNRDLTQEQVAEMLCVSSQAVSKWETGIALPDISLLPIIANLFCVSVDCLLGVDISQKESEICAVLSEAEKYCDERRYTDAVCLLREALIKYPAEPRLMYQLAWSLTGTIRERPESLSEAISLYEKVLNISSDPHLCAMVTRDLMYRYSTTGEDEKALSIAKTLPDFGVCKEYNLGRSNLLRGRELGEYLIANIRLYGDAMKECLEYFLTDKIISQEDMLPYSTEIAKQKLGLLEEILG